MDFSLLNNLIEKNYLKKIFYYDELDSTNNYAKDNNVISDSIVIASNQIHGRGRFDRIWEAKPNENITITLTKEFEIQSEDIHLINFYTSYIIFLSLKSVIKDECGKLSVKWPNDILLNGKKISGILTETDKINNDIKKFYIGIGINVNQKVFSGYITDKATSLYNETGEKLNIEKVIYSIVEFFYTNLELLKDKHNLIQLWKSHFPYINKIISFITSDTTNIISGRVLDVNDDGGIKIEIDDISNTKKIEVFYSGEISFIYAIN